MLTKIKNNLIYPIIFLAIILRFFNINSYPSLNPDEAALGYNAYSLINTGKDEHGISWPLHFKSFGDYKPGLYVYLAIPFVKFLGLNELSVRFPNLILSVLTIFFVYKLIFLLTEKKNLAALCAFVLTINPWHLHFSRGAWESSVALSFIIIGTFYFYHYLQKKNIFSFYFFVILFSLSLYTYHSARIFAPLLALFLLSSQLKNFKKLILPCIFGILITLPVIYSFLTSGGATRFGGVGLTADQGPVWRANELINHHHNTLIINRAMHNKRVLYALSWAQKYFSHFNFNFLFLTGDEVPRSKIPDFGQFYIFEFAVLLFGIVKISRYNHSQLKRLLIFWIIFAPLASSLTFQAPSALRSLFLVVPLSIVIAFGLYSINHNLTKYLLLTVYIFSFLFYLDNYYLHYQKRYPYAWNYGFKELINYTESVKDKYQNIYITNKYDQPYILYLFYSKADPKNIQSQLTLTSPDEFGFSTVKKLNQYNFDKINWDSIPKESLVVTADENTSANPIKEIKLGNQSIFKIYEK